MIEYVNLFKSLPVPTRTKTFSTDFLDRGVLVEDSVAEAYPRATLLDMIEKLIPSDAEMNKTFHKSWRKVRDASLEQLVVEQVIHYFTTYGFESMGFYNEDSVYVPNERLELEAKGGVTFLVLKGITKDEVADRVQKILESGIALSDSDLDDLVDVVQHASVHVDLDKCANREMRVRLWDMLGETPKDPVEYLRLQVYRVTESTMLIKSPEVIKDISDRVRKNVFTAYEKAYGLEGLASIFYRFKPLFLAFKNGKSANTVNRIRKLANKHHKPMPEDYLGATVKHLRDETFDRKLFAAALSKANVFRKIKLLQALRFYANEAASGVIYSVRNGKAFVSQTTPVEGAGEPGVILLNSLGEDLQYLKGKSVYVPAGLVAPTSGKMFYGDLPVGSSFTTEDSLVVGVSWHDVKSYRVDLDLSALSLVGKIGWDGGYRNADFLWSGDITAAPNGATEALLVRKNVEDGIYLFNLNYYNGWGDAPEVPYKMFVTEESEFKRIDGNAAMSQDNMLFWADSSIDAKRSHKSIGVLKVNDGVKTFYAFESKIGRGASARNDGRSNNMISYYSVYLDSLVQMDKLLGSAGAKLVDDPKDADIDLSLPSLTKDALISVLSPGS